MMTPPLLYALSGRLMLAGEDRAVFAYEGDEIVLNCSLGLLIPAGGIEEANWRKTDADRDILVLLYQDSEVFPDSLHERYDTAGEFHVRGPH